MRSLVLTLLLALAALAMAPRPAQALPCNASCSCSVAVDPAAFGGVNPLDFTGRTITFEVAVTCRVDNPTIIFGDWDVSYGVELMPGNGTLTDPRMAQGADVLRYGLYLDAALTRRWGDGTGGTRTIRNNGLTIRLPQRSRTETWTVWGRLPGGQNVPVGTYLDALLARVVY